MCCYTCHVIIHLKETFSEMLESHWYVLTAHCATVNYDALLPCYPLSLSEITTRLSASFHPHSHPYNHFYFRLTFCKSRQWLRLECIHQSKSLCMSFALNKEMLWRWSYSISYTLLYLETTKLLQLQHALKTTTISVTFHCAAIQLESAEVRGHDKNRLAVLLN